MKSKSLHLKNINNIHHVEEPFKIKEPTQRKFDNLFSPRNSSKNFYHDKTFDSESLMHQKYQILNEVSKARKKIQKLIMQMSLKMIKPFLMMIKMVQTKKNKMKNYVKLMKIYFEIKNEIL